MYYQLYDLQHQSLMPLRLMAELTSLTYQNPYLPTSYTSIGRSIAAGAEIIERNLRYFDKPKFGLYTTKIDDKEVAVKYKTILEKPFGDLKFFKRDTNVKQPNLLVVAPMSGHYATLLRGTVKSLLPHFNVYITDWKDAKTVPLKDGTFNLDDYISYLFEFIKCIGENTHILAVCQPAVPVMAACSLIAEHPSLAPIPKSMTLMGGPIDTRVSKTEVNKLAETKDLAWFEKNVIHPVPAYYPGGFRKVYPGFIQLSGFMSMNLDRHIGAYFKMYDHLVKGDGEPVAKQRAFYDEYLSVMDLSADFYLQTIETVFQKHLLPQGKMMWKGKRVNPAAISKTALLTVEGELDDISATGQTKAAHDICKEIPATMKKHHFQEQVGHYGIFNGRKWHECIMPVVRDFIYKMDKVG